MTPKKKVKEEAVASSEATTPAFTPTTANIEAALADPNNAVPFVQENTADNSAIILPARSFFDQELGEVIFNKLMKAPVKDYQVLLRLSKLGKTINEISHKLAVLRDAISKDCGLDELAKQETALTPETLNSPEYQAKSLAFGQMINEYLFSKQISLAPLGALTLNLPDPDGHARAFIEGSTLSMDDIDMLDGLGIIKVIYPESNAPVEENSQSAENDVLVPNEDN